MRRSMLFVGVWLLIAPMPGAAQERHGFWFNGGLGYGSLGCEDCGSREGGLSGGLSLGGTLSPKLLLGVGTTGWYKDVGGASLTVGTLDARLRWYPSRTGGFFLTTGLGVGSIRASADGFGSASETGVGFMLGLGYDIRVGSGVSLTPFWNGFAVRTDNSDANVGQLGLSLTLHKFTQPSRQADAPPPPARLITPPRAPDPQAPTPASAPAPAPLPVAAPLPPADVGTTELPVGTNYVGDTRLKLYYPIGCAAQHSILPQFQVFFQTGVGAEADGFKRSGDC
jgi:hypothetical protein